MSYWKESYMKICRGELYKKAAPPSNILERAQLFGVTSRF